MTVVPHLGMADTDTAVAPGRVRVLLVEDDDGIAEPLAQGLAREGFEVSRVATGAQALSAPPPDVVLLDLGLPDIDGYAVCQQLRARSVGSDPGPHRARGRDGPSGRTRTRC